ncbi:acetyl-CoA carboxylase biotin carboxyl carrier protein subunit, partial [Streptomyces fuscigenes]|uniref:acetyl-CoA carboxylase biotin carboxyl carrier protein subunit n=1 Tax=Streptomyces fuscigenes TaxID=1528880 RepID=UPI0027E1A330
GGGTDGAGWRDPFAAADGWRLGGTPAWVPYHFRVPGEEPVTVRVRGGEVRVGDAEAPVAARLVDGGGPGADGSPAYTGTEYAGTVHRFACASTPDGVWLGRDGDSWELRDHDPVEAGRSGAALGQGSLTAPMPGTVTVVKVASGDTVEAGQSLLVVEAMKMEHVVSAPYAGTVTELDVRPGSTVAMDQVLAVVTPEEES